MSNYIIIQLDTTAPSNPTIVINGGATYSNQDLVDLLIGTSDSITTGYQMKIWGNVDEGHDSNIKATEGSSAWISFSTTKQIKLSSGDGAKTIYLRLRDDVHNQSSVVSDTIQLDMSLPNVTVGQPDVSKISLQPTKNTSSFTFTSSTPFIEYKVKVVSSAGATHTTGEQIHTDGGSVNTSGIGEFDAPITVTIKGEDLLTASSGDGDKIIKVFVKNIAGTWSV
ncbi:hypothetical protein PQE75_gp208 [Bacillus phage vB_BcoS-136]|uniref:Uncharacterized protein n=1 Tax=Bacillus phage vB_BcoS-136 TaxID=2419619 RepID=A0A3G3BVU0_9CAUD|nr:hypothetical protein PQE75_gp208 [Bacillus phage vB_BcoS-136]AYP68271.1 hypothetical protein vBBcoS136_00157 [Bacillus phage vB_BcoS-136]